MPEPKIRGEVIRAVIDGLVSPAMSLQDFPRAAEALSVQDGEFYPVKLYNELTDFLEAKYSPTVFRSLGRSIGRMLLDRFLLPRGVQSLHEAASLMQATHQAFALPPEGEFKVVAEREGYLAIRYTCPYNCVLQEGLFFEGARRFGGLVVHVHHSKCRRRGDDHCLFEMEY